MAISRMRASAAAALLSLSPTGSAAVDSCVCFRLALLDSESESFLADSEPEFGGSALMSNEPAHNHVLICSTKHVAQNKNTFKCMYASMYVCQFLAGLF
jgi:hypothetical protein